MPLPTPTQLANRMKADIVSDVQSGRVPSTVSSFAQLHDYTDANCYGGTEALFSELVTESATDAEHQIKLDQLNDVMGPAMAIVDRWIKGGALPRAQFHMANGMNVENAALQTTIEAPLGFKN